MTETAETPPLAALTPLPAPSPVGIGGWLILPILHLIADIVIFVLIFVQAAAPQMSPTIAAPSGPVLPPAPVSGVAVAPGPSQGEFASVAFLVFTAAIAAYTIYCLVRFFQKKEQVPALMTGFYSLIIAKAFLNLVLLNIYPELITGPGDTPEAVRGIVRAVVSGAIWIAYFNRSVRVQNTFVH